MDDRRGEDDRIAAVGRRDFLRRMGYAAATVGWLQTTNGRLSAFGADAPDAGRIRRGYDFMTTTVAHQWIEVPASMLGPGMKPFEELVEFGSSPLNSNVGNADTIMERLDDAVFGRPVRTRLVSFSNVSSEPIELRGSGRMAGEYWLYVTLSPTADSPGEMILVTVDGGVSGSFTSKVTLAPLFELRPVGGGESVFVDTGRTELPNFPMRLGTTGGTWTTRPTPEHAVGWKSGQSLYYVGTSQIIAHRQPGDRAGRRGTESPDEPLAPVTDLLAKCDKVQAVHES